eukprot:783637-Rhodomonas_salina.6
MSILHTTCTIRYVSTAHTTDNTPSSYRTARSIRYANTAHSIARVVAIPNTVWGEGPPPRSRRGALVPGRAYRPSTLLRRSRPCRARSALALARSARATPRSEHGMGSERGRR